MKSHHLHPLTAGYRPTHRDAINARYRKDLAEKMKQAGLMIRMLTEDSSYTATEIVEVITSIFDAGYASGMSEVTETLKAALRDNEVLIEQLSKR